MKGRTGSSQPRNTVSMEQLDSKGVKLQGPGWGVRSLTTGGGGGGGMMIRTGTTPLQKWWPIDMHLLPLRVQFRCLRPAI